MNILVLTNLYPPDMLGGYELGCRQAVEALRSRGHRVRVLTSAPRSPRLAVEPDVVRTFRLTEVWSHYLFQHTSMEGAYQSQAESLRVNASNVHALLDELRTNPPDVVYAWMLVGLGGLGLMATLEHLSIPWAWHLMDDVPVSLCRVGERLVPALAGEFSRQFNGTFLACSQQLVDEIHRAGVPLGGEVEVEPNWVAGPLPEPRSTYLDGGHLRIVSAAGQIERRSDKGMDLLVEAAGLLRERGYDQFSMDLYGTVGDASIPDLIRHHDLEATVRLMGPRRQRELFGLLGEYDLFAFPTRPREPFGFAPLEAAARGCVPVISEICGIAEWLVHGIHCLKAPRTAEAFADAFAAVLDGEVDPAPIGRRAAAVARRDFHIDAIIPRIEQALLRAAGRPREHAGTFGEAYHLALLAERLSRVLVHDAIGA